MISIDTKVNFAFFLSLISILWNIVLYAKGRKLEKIRVYDKVYGISEWLLMFEYNNSKNREYLNHDKELEKAVREHSKSHHMAQLFGIGFDIPDNLSIQEDRDAFCKKVYDEYKIYSKTIDNELWAPILEHNQSPVFCMDNEEFKEKFDFVFKYIGENLSYFSPALKKAWHDAQNNTPSHVKQQYISLNKLNKSSCEPFEDEYIDDPYVEILKSIRHEYRKLTKTNYGRWESIKWGAWKLCYKVKDITNLSKRRSLHRKRSEGVFQVLKKYK